MPPDVLLRIRLPLALAAGLLAGGCATTPPAPVDDRSIGSPRTRAHAERHHAPVSAPASGTHRVQRGDTLYSIAFRNGLDYRELARRNRIAPPYTIYVGQELHLGGEPRQPDRVVARTPARTPATPPPRTVPPPVAPRAAAPGSFEDAPPVAVTVAPGRSTPVAPGVRPNLPEAPRPEVAPAPPAPATTASNAGLGWRWPADGARVGSFVAGDQTRQGVDIAGRAGDPVRAAADGEVVYSGNGLIGYGELIIVKHSPSLLSAYGHNRRRLVQEGEKVKGGQQIAEMGSSSASRDMLHFEIRRDGKPVDPLGFLPAR